MPLNKETLNSTPTLLLQRWPWHWITHEGWYATKQRNQTLTTFQHMSNSTLCHFSTLNFSSMNNIMSDVTSLSKVTDIIIKQCEINKFLLILRCVKQFHIILVTYLLLPSLWSYKITLDSEMPSLPDTLWVLLTRTLWFGAQHQNLQF